VAQVTEEEEDARLMEGGITATERVPFSAMNRLTAVAAEVKNEPLEEFARRAGRFVAEYGTRTVYKYVMILMPSSGVSSPG
jgi:hypothetical protein